MHVFVLGALGSTSDQDVNNSVIGLLSIGHDTIDVEDDEAYTSVIIGTLRMWEREPVLFRIRGTIELFD